MVDVIFVFLFLSFTVKSAGTLTSFLVGGDFPWVGSLRDLWAFRAVIVSNDLFFCLQKTISW